MSDMEQEEAWTVADLSILEFYLHRSIVLRLRNHGKDDSDAVLGLKQAQAFGLIVQGIFNIATG